MIISLIDNILQPFKDILGMDYMKYRNHVYRVYLFCTALDNNENNHEKYAIAAIYHDIGIWTNNTFDYLIPSIEKACEYLKENNKEEWQHEISIMVDMHHKMSRYKGSYQNTVEVFRKADWVDVTKGVLKFSITPERIKDIKTQYPNSGFHLFLLKMSIRQFLKTPLNPLPMFKK